MDLTDLRGRLTVVLTPELRQLALAHVRSTIPDESDPERIDLVEWFQEQETPDGHVLDAAYSEADATMIDVVLRVFLDMHDAPVVSDEPDLDANVRIIAR